MNGEKQIRVAREIPSEWERLMRLAKSIEYGEARIIFNKGKPIRADFVIKQVKLTDESEFQKDLSTIPIL